MKLKKHFIWWEPGHNENECRNHSAGVEEDLEANVTELSGGRGTGVSSPAAEQDACLLHENDSDQRMYSCPSPTDRGGDGLENLAASSSLQAWFDMEVLEARENDNLDVVVTTEQHSKTTFRPDVQVEPSEEVPDNSESITSVDTRKVERKFAVRNVTELIVDDGKQADKGRKMWLNDVDGLFRCMRSAGRIERLLRSKRSFGELWNQKRKCVIPCDKHLCSFLTLCEQESGQTRQMDRGVIEVEEERRVRTKRMLVLLTEKRENESTHVASRSQCETEDSRKHLEIESSLPRVAKDRGFLARSTDADLVTNTMLILKLHSAVEARQVSHEAPEPHAVNCALENLDENCLGRVLLIGSVGYARTFVDRTWVGRGERMVVEKGSECLHQSSGAGENDVREIESSAMTNYPDLPEELGCRANSKGIVPPWVAGYATHVLHQSEKRRNARTRSRMRKSRDVLTQDVETGSWK